MKFLIILVFGLAGSNFLWAASDLAIQTQACVEQSPYKVCYDLFNIQEGAAHFTVLKDGNRVHRIDIPSINLDSILFSGPSSVVALEKYGNLYSIDLIKGVVTKKVQVLKVPHMFMGGSSFDINLKVAPNGDIYVLDQGHAKIYQVNKDDFSTERVINLSKVQKAFNQFYFNMEFFENGAYLVTPDFGGNVYVLDADDSPLVFGNPKDGIISSYLSTNDKGKDVHIYYQTSDYVENSIEYKVIYLYDLSVVRVSESGKFESIKSRFHTPGASSSPLSARTAPAREGCSEHYIADKYLKIPSSALANPDEALNGEAFPPVSGKGNVGPYRGGYQKAMDSFHRFGFAAIASAQLGQESDVLKLMYDEISKLTTKYKSPEQMIARIRELDNKLEYCKEYSANDFGKIRKAYDLATVQAIMASLIEQ